MHVDERQLNPNPIPMLAHLTGIARHAELLMQAILIVCFFRWNLLGRYRWFVSFLFVDLIRSCALLGLDNHSIVYAKAWSFTQPVIWVLELAAVLELMLLIYQYRPAAEKFLVRLLVYYVPSALLVSVIVSLFESIEVLNVAWWLVTAIKITKWLSWLLLFMLAAQEVLHLTESKPIERDVILHRRLLAVYVGVTPSLTAVFALLRDTHIGDVANLCLETSWVLCLLCWIVCFRNLTRLRRTRFAEELG